MNITNYDVGGLPVVKIENYYTEEELKLLWTDIDLLTVANQLLSPKQNFSAVDSDNKPLKNNMGANIDALFPDRNQSRILKVNRKIFTLSDDLVKTHKYFRFLKYSNMDATKIAYYEEGEHYKKHFDHAAITAVTIHYKEPKAFTGGELVFEDGELVIPCENNTAIIFPSILYHEVKDIMMLEQKSGYGRYSLIQFITMV
jgi:hypothetical protein